MNKLFYPVEWDVVAQDIKDTCNYRCLECNRQCRRPGELYLGWAYEAAIAHLTQDYGAEAVTVAMLCGECHFLHDAPLVWVARRRVLNWQRQVSGQLDLFAARG